MTENSNPFHRIDEIRRLRRRIRNPQVGAALDDLLGIIESYQKGMQMIRETGGPACENQELCPHDSCRASVYMYLVADSYLRGWFSDRKPRWLSGEWKMPRIPDDPLVLLAQVDPIYQTNQGD